MYEVGGNAGQTYVAPEGQGLSEVISFPKTENYRLMRAEYALKQRDKQEEKDKIERQKAMGIFDQIPKEWQTTHIVQLQKEMGDLINKASEAMTSRNNPFDIRYPDGKALADQLQNFQAKAMLSKNVREQADAFEKRQDLEKYDDKSVEAMRQAYRRPIDDWMNGKVDVPKLKLKNPYSDQANLWSKVDLIKEASKEHGYEDKPELFNTVVKSVIQQNPEARDFYQSAYDALSEPEKKEIMSNAYAEYTNRHINDKMNGSGANLSSDQYAAVQAKKEEELKTLPLEIMARDFLKKTYTGKPFDYDSFLNKDLKVGDIVNVGGNQEGTWNNKNTNAQAYKKNARELAESYFKTDDKALRGMIEKFGIKATDKNEQIKLAAKQVADDKYRMANKQSGFRQYKLGQGEINKEELAATGEKWLNNLYSGDPTLEKDAAGFIFGKNSVFGDNIKDVNVYSGIKNPLTGNSSPDRIQIKYDNDMDAARAAKILTSQGISGLDDPEIQAMKKGFNNEVWIPRTEENKQRLLGIYEGAAQAKKKPYKQAVRQKEFDNIGSQNAAPKSTGLNFQNFK